MIARSARPAVAGLYSVGADGRPLLCVSRCRACGERAFPARERCAQCLAADPELIEYGPDGELYAFTIVHEAFGRGSLPPPYGVAKVRFADGFLVQGLLDPKFSGWAVGQQVETTEMVLEEENETDLLTYAFRPATVRAKERSDA